MASHDSQFGIGPLPSLPPVMFGAALAALGAFLLLIAEPLIGGTMACLGLIFLAIGLMQRRRERAAAALAPLSSADLTARALRGLGITPGDLLANDEQRITRAQWLRVSDRLGTVGEIAAPLPAIQVAEGPVSLSTHGNHLRGWYELAIDGLVFTREDTAFISALKRGARYRLRFIELPTAWTIRPTARVVIAAEALGDA